jgi:hypothetical protein
LVRGRVEPGRSESYSGEEFFYGVLQKLLEGAGSKPKDET